MRANFPSRLDRNENCPQDLGPDFDFGASPILHTLPGGRRALLAGQKSGQVFAHDPNRQGAVVWKTMLVDKLGAAEILFGGAADEQTAYFGLDNGVLAAVNPATGERKWSVTVMSQATRRGLTAALTVIPGVVFAGRQDGRVRAFASDSGRMIWGVQHAPGLQDGERRCGERGRDGRPWADGCRRHAVCRVRSRLHFEQGEQHVRFVPLIAALALVTSASSSSSVRPVAGRNPERFGGTVQTPGTRAAVTPDAAVTDRVRQAYSQLPLSFEANQGQTDPRVDFLSRGAGYTLFLSPSEAVLLLSKAPPASPAPRPSRDQKRQSAVLRMKLIDANEHAEAAATEPLPGKVNYFIGHDPARWRTGIPTYAKTTYREVYRGIDVVYYGNQRQLEYDFVVRPGSSATTIGLRFEGADRVEVDADGELLLHTGVGVIRNSKPHIYQVVDGRHQPIAGGYVLHERSQVGFEVGNYDTSQPLVIDPTLVYSTFLGGSIDDTGTSIVVDALDNAYVTGLTNSANFPTQGAFDASYNGGGSDAFVTKLNATGSAPLVYSTYLGGIKFDAADGIALDDSGSAYVTGYTESEDFPTTASAFDTTLNGGSDAFVTKLDATGSLLGYSTYLGGNSSEGTLGIFSIRVDGTGAYVTGDTSSTDFPTTPAAFDTTNNGASDAFVTKLNATGSAPLLYSTYLGGSDHDLANGIALDASGNAYVTGRTDSADFPTTLGAYDVILDGGSDAFVTKLNAIGSAPLMYSTYLGGNDIDIAQGIGLDTFGKAYVTGYTSSTDFPTTAGAFDIIHDGGTYDAFVTKLNDTGSDLDYSTFLGGASFDFARGIAVDGSANAYVTGQTFSADFPTKRALQISIGGTSDAFVTKLSATGSALLYSTYLGGSADDSGYAIAVDAADSAYVTGFTRSTNFPTTPLVFDTTHNGFSDGFVAKISDVRPPPPATVTLEPAADSNPVDSEHCVTATVKDAAGDPVPDVTVRFEVTGSVNETGSATTDASGHAEFCYQGPSFPGTDTIIAYADTDGDHMQGPGEPSGTATKTWVAESTPHCTVTNHGRIVAANGDRATFSGHAQSNARGKVSGQEHYRDHGPAERLRMRSIEVLAVVCEDAKHATIYGRAKVNGSGPFDYRLSVKDLGEPGRGRHRDTYWLVLDNGYDSGEQVLRSGNVQIKIRRQSREK